MLSATLEPALPPHEFLLAAAKLAAQHLKQAPRPLFANPACYFAVDGFGVLTVRKLRYLTRRDATTHSPAQILRHLSALSTPASTATVILAIATDTLGEIHASPEAEPEQISLYLAAVSDPNQIEHRLVQLTADSVVLLPPSSFAIRCVPCSVSH